MGGNESKRVDHKSQIVFSEEEKPMVHRLFYKISYGKKTFNREQFRVSRLYTFCDFVKTILHYTTTKVQDMPLSTQLNPVKLRFHIFKEEIS